MADSRRCSLCAISYPTSVFGVCRVCAGRLDLIIGEPPDEDWADKVKSLKEDPVKGGKDVLDATQEVAAWRMLALLDAGYSVEDASALSVRFDIDLHKACDLIVKGCEPTLASSILL